MSRWIEHYRNHPFHSSWNEFSKALAEKSLFAHGETPAAAVEVARLRKVAAYIDGILEQIDPELVPVSLLDALSNSAAQARDQVVAFLGNGNLGYLNNANSHLDALLVTLSQTPFLLHAGQKGALTKAATAFSEAMQGHLEAFAARVKSELEYIDQKIGKNETASSANLTSLQELREQIKNAENTIQGQIAQFNSQFAASEGARSERFETVVAALQNKADIEFVGLATKAGVALKVLGKYQDDAKKVLGVVVNTAQAGAYSLYAKEERRAANWLRLFAMVLMLFGVALLVYPELAKLILQSDDYVLDWKRMLGRVPMSLILFVPAFYLARESGKHRVNEVVNRRRELILSTLDPYLVMLDDDQAKSVKVEIAKGIFSEGHPARDDNSDEAGGAFAQIIGLASKALKKSG